MSTDATSPAVGSPTTVAQPTTVTSVTAGAVWEVVIGLEVHTELATETKLFCGCRNEFGATPNTHVCPVCLGLPGSLPVLNEKAVEFALRVGEAMHFDVPPSSIFHRKNYFYPDMPKNFQTSQYDEPICRDGFLEIDGARIGITRAHLEEDTGKTSHVGGDGGRIHGADHSLVDYNRAGVPLMEIVSEPDIRSAEQAKAYVAELRATLAAIGVSDVKMEEGSLRIDANISVRPLGSTTFGTRTETKNVNSLRSLGRAIEYEIERQIEVLESGGTVVQETRHWNEDDGRTHSMRSKEEAYDYRYFPEPDLVPIAPTAEMRRAVRAAMPELPAARRARLLAEWGISEHDARVLLADPALADYAEAAVAALPSATEATAKDVVNWASGDLLALLNDAAVKPGELQMPASALADVVDLAASGAITRKQAKDVLREAFAHDRRPREIVAQQGLAQVSDEGAIGPIVDGVLAARAADVEEWRAGDDKVRKKKRGFLMGEVMKALQGQGNPGVVNEILDRRLGN